MGLTLWRSVALILVYTAASDPIKFTQLLGEGALEWQAIYKLAVFFYPKLYIFCKYHCQALIDQMQQHEATMSARYRRIDREGT